MKLHKLQQDFADAIIANTSDSISGRIRADRISAAERLSVYHYNVVGNLMDALADTFAATQQLVGEEFFRNMARRFVPANLPNIANLNLYGGEFPAFIAAYAPATTLHYLSDVAQFEWFWNESFFAQDDAALSPQEIASITPDDYLGLCLNLRKSARLFVSNYPVDAIWRWCEDGGNGAAPDMNESVFLLISRPELEVQVTRLTHAEYCMLLALSKGDVFEIAASQALQEDANFDLAGFMARHFTAKTFQSFTR